MRLDNHAIFFLNFEKAWLDAPLVFFSMGPLAELGQIFKISNVLFSCFSPHFKNKSSFSI